MATDAQILANRANCLRSTGPREGKAISRRNALKHGLTATVLTPDEHEQAVDERREAWRVGYEIRTVEDEWVFDELVASSVRVDLCRRQKPELTFHLARRAELCWDEDRSLAAERQAVRLPKAPALVVRKPEQTWHGCDLLLGRWFALRDALEAGRDWTEAERSAALDLLGMPAEVRDPAVASDRQWAERAVAAEVDRLTALRDGALAELDASERAMAAAGMPLDPPPALRLLRRYEAEAMRRYFRARAQLKCPGAKPAKETAPAAPLPAARPPEVPPWTDEKHRELEARLKRMIAALPEPEAGPAPEPEAVAAPAPAPARSSAAAPPMNRKQRRRDAKLQRSRR